MNYLKSIDEIMAEKLKNTKNNLFDTDAMASHISIYSASTNTDSK